MAHAVSVLDEYANRGALETILFSIAKKSIIGKFSFVFFFVSDSRLVRLYRRFGMEFPDDLRFPHSKHVVGIYEPTALRNLERMRATAKRLGVALETTL
jgi:hypothetical protein